MQSALILSSGSNVPDGDAGGEDGLDDGGVEVHHHSLRQVELLWLPQMAPFWQGCQLKTLAKRQLHVWSSASQKHLMSPSFSGFSTG